MSWTDAPLMVSSYTLGTAVGFQERVRVAAAAGFAGIGLRAETACRRGTPGSTSWWACSGSCAGEVLGKVDRR